MDATIESLIGATIVKASRRKSAIELVTSTGRHIILGSMREREELACYGCGEERSIEIVVTAGRKEAVCCTCAHSWVLV